MSEFDEPKIDQLFDVLLNKLIPDFYEAAERLGVSNEELQAVVDGEWHSTLGTLWARFCEEAIGRRRTGQLVAMFDPELDKGGVSLTVLVDRFNRRKADA